MTYQKLGMSLGAANLALAVVIVVGWLFSLVAPGESAHWRDALVIALLAGPFGVATLVESLQHPERACRIIGGLLAFSIFAVVATAVIVVGPHE
jgi:hypothetical protein